MNNRVILSISCCILLFLLLCTPALAAAVTCPSSCSCLLPAEAKKLGYAGYCGGKQNICGYDTQKNEKYCYEKPATTAPQLIATLKPVVTTTKPTVTKTIVSPVPVAQCPSGCSCLSMDAGKAKGLPYCSGKQVRCGYDTTQTPLYCFSSKTTTTVATTQTTVPSSCPSGCSCVLPDEAKAKGMMYCNGKQTVCAVPSVKPATGVASSSSNKYCYSLPETSCPQGCSCLAPDKADAAGYTRCSGSAAACSTDPLGRPMYCYVTGSAGSVRLVAAGTSTAGTSGTPAPAGSAMSINLPVTSPATTLRPEGGAFAGIATFFASLFGGKTVPGPQGFRVIDCPFGLTDCGGVCVNLRTDTNNCGRCGVACPGQLPLCCDGTCSSLSSAENCGACGNACPSDRPCTTVDGHLTCSNDGCNPLFSSTDCGTGLCVDLDSDSRHCGGCGNACPEHSICNIGVCTPCGTGHDRCGEGSIASGGYCFDLQIDPWNCGACGNPCGPGDICEGGACVPCPTGTERCGRDCVDLRTDRNSCGSCFTYCYDNVLSGGTTCCDGSCTNLEANNTHCGTCGNSCGENQRCIGGMCALMPTGTVEVTCRLGQTACGITCTNLGSDEFNCGACGRACMSGRVCIDGVCLLEGGEDGCGLGQIRCSGRCVYPETDRANCGTCGHACPDRYYCRESTCTPFFSGDDTVCDTPGLDYCLGDCANLQTDERHCGRCGNSCTGGSCIDGTCYYLNSDRANCGSVGHRCAAGEICCSGTCRAENTGDPERCACSTVPCRAADGLGCCNGYCWALNTDGANCGACGHACEGGDWCCGGRCTSMRWDEDNCGYCGNECPWNKECQNGSCCLWGTTWGCD